MSATVKDLIHKSLEAANPGADELIKFSFEKLSADPGTPANGTEWINTTDSRRRVRMGTTTQSYAFLTDVTGVWKSRGTHATNSLPTAATATVNANAALENYNTFLMTNTAAVTITGIQGASTLHSGDVLVLVDAASPTVAASWVGIQRNMNDTLMTVPVTVTLASLPADTLTTVTLTGIGTAYTYNVELSDGTAFNGLVRRTAANVITLGSSVALTNLVVRAVGTVA
jgi:hypothetical protein